SGPGLSGLASILRRNGQREDLPSKKMIVLHPGDQLWEYIPGGAGYGDPLERDSALVLADVLDGKVSRESARETYGVALASDGRAVDEVATVELREERQRERGPITWLFDRGPDGRVALRDPQPGSIAEPRVSGGRARGSASGRRRGG